MIRAITICLTTLLAAGFAAGCGGVSETGAESGGDGGRLTLVAYSTPREAYEEIIPAFQGTAAGSGVSFDQSYGSSGEQSRAVEAGLPADVVAFSLEPDVTRLVEANLVEAGWAENEYAGMVTDSVVVFAVRKGNPKQIQSWDDLVREDLEVITPNPFTSGGARWNLMAAYGAQRELGNSHEQAVEFLGQLLANTAVQDKSAREALQTFVGGKGDVMIVYENEAITA
ncbi:MAG: extracellular solute-binding protein, partial [Gaiellaceae bacterium]